VAALGLALMVIVLAPPQALGANLYDHLFDPSLSLEGDCNGEDGVLDPSCPYQAPPLGPHPFDRPCGVATDRYGDIYVATPAGESGEGRIDVFDSKGEFLTEVPNAMEPCQVSVDSAGNLYVLERQEQTIEGLGRRFVDRYEPDSFPLAAEPEYTLAAKFKFTPTEEEFCGTATAQPRSLTVDPSNDYLYIARTCRVEEYGSAAEGNSLLRCCIGQFVAGTLDTSLQGVDVYGRSHDLYVVNKTNNDPIIDSVFILDGTTGKEKCELRGTGVEGDSGFDFGLGGPIAVDQSDGELFVYDLGHAVIDQFALDEEGGGGCPQYSFARQMPPPSTDKKPLFNEPNVNIAVDSPCRAGPELAESCDLRKYESPNPGEVYITVGRKATNSHLYAFKPRNVQPPEIRAQAVSGIAETEALLGAEVNPGGLETSYRLEYTTQADFEAHGYTNAIEAPGTPVSAGAGGAFITVAVPVDGLVPGTAYRFRLVASNCEDEEADPEACLTVGEGAPGGEGEDASFATYPEPAPSARAYELVTPPDTGGHIPTISMLGGEFSFSGFPASMVSPDGKGLLFGSRTGALPGVGGGGYQDTYEARRENGGWQTQFTGLSGTESEKPRLGSVSPEHAYYLWYIWPEDRGTLFGGGKEANGYLRVPTGTPHSPNCAVPGDPTGRMEWVACGALGADPATRGMWISAGANHVVFETTKHLEDCAPPSGTNAIYDRTPGGVTRCVSLLPSGDPPVLPATYRSTSADGSAVAFTVQGTLYVRLDDSETVEVATGSPTFGGLARDGGRVFYLKGGDVFSFDTASEEAVKVGEGSESTLVYVSPDGSHAFFVSPKQLDGDEGEAGKDNLYAWDGTAAHFVAVLDPIDLSGKDVLDQGLERWINSALNPVLGPGTGPADDPARSTPDGSVFVFESQADLGGFESNGRRQVYRYEQDAPPGEALLCLSCDPTGVPTAAAGQLESLPVTDPLSTVPPVNSLTQIANVTDDGERVFFQTSARLLSADIDGKQDVYEWRAQGSTGCNRKGGCLALISYARSTADEYLYAMTPDGHDVFFLSADTLVPQDPDATPSIYDARVDGGFPPPPNPNDPCLGEACQPAAVAPEVATPATSVQKPGNPRPVGKRPCPKAKRTMRHAGKRRCTKRHAKTKQRRHRHGRGTR
jgi:hypothetical protein